jgi:hypothetical protein
MEHLTFFCPLNNKKRKGETKRLWVSSILDIQSQIEKTENCKPTIVLFVPIILQHVEKIKFEVGN